MNLQQFEYICAVDETGSFSRAAEKCFITQPTLSMMIQKLEDELGTVLFERKSSPVKPTATGTEIIRMARRVLLDVAIMKEIAVSVTAEISGELRIGIIPTVAPFLLPLWLKDFNRSYPQLKLKIFELTTETILSRLAANTLDIGIAATPLAQPGIKEIPLYREEFLVYAANTERLLRKKYVLSEDIDVNHLWLLEDGHCLRSQVLQVCELRKLESLVNDIVYETGSIESLIKMVDSSGGITIVPELAAAGLTKKQTSRLRQFANPVPVREISLIMQNYYPRKRIVEALKTEIQQHVNICLFNRKKQQTIAATP